MTLAVTYYQFGRKSMNKSHTIAASDARNNFSDLISKVQYQGNVYLIERYGEVVAKLVPATFKEESAPNQSVDSDEGKVAETKAESSESQTSKTSLTSESQTSPSKEAELPESATTTLSSTWSSHASYRQVTPMGRTMGMGSMTGAMNAGGPLVPPISHSDQDKDNESQPDDQVNSKVDSSNDQDMTSTSAINRIAQQESTESVANLATNTTPKNDSGWSALKKLEELIEAQKRKNEVAAQTNQEAFTTTPIQPLEAKQESSNQYQTSSASTAWDQPVTNPAANSATSSATDSAAKPTTPDYSNWLRRSPFFQEENKSESGADQSDQPEKVDVIRKRIDL